MTKRPSLRASVPAPTDEAARAVEQVRELQRRQDAPQGGADVPMTTSTVHLPVDLLSALRQAAERRATNRAIADDKGRGGRPSVSEIVVELLTRHRDELDKLD